MSLSSSQANCRDAGAADPGTPKILTRQAADKRAAETSLVIIRDAHSDHPVSPGHILQERGKRVIDVVSKLGGVKEKTAEALRASEADHGASVVLVAVVREFDSKADKANRMANGDGSARDAVVELEQAGDSAKAAAEADPGLGEAARTAVLDAHLAICILKTEI
jgi:hypothetical protein